MASYDELVSLFRQIVETYQKVPKYTKGVLGKVTGEVYVPNRDDYAFARFSRGSSEDFEIFNKNAPFVKDWPVLIGEFPWMPGLTQIVGTDWEAYEKTGWGDSTTNEPHAPTHEWRDRFLGADPLSIYGRAMAMGRGYALGSTGTVVYVNAFEYGTGTVWAGTPGIDLQPIMGTLVTGTAQFAGIYVQGSDNTLQVVTGTTGVDTLAFDPPLVDFPVLRTNIPIARVRLYGNQSGIRESDFRDARRFTTGLEQEIISDKAKSIDDLIMGVNSASDSDFVSTISSSSGQDIVYGVVSSGDEANILPSNTPTSANLILHNTTRSEELLIEDVDTGTNTITCTENVPGTWQNGDAITTRSQTNTAVVDGSAYFFDYKLGESIDVKANSFSFQFTIADSGAITSSIRALIHPYEANDNQKRSTFIAQVSGVDLSSFHPEVLIINQRFCLAWQASGANTMDINIRLSGEQVVV